MIMPQGQERLATGGEGRAVPPLAALRPRHLVGIALCGLVFDLAWRNGPAALASAAAVVVVASVLLSSGRLQTRSSQLLVGAATAFGLALAARTSPWLVPLDLAAAWGLIGAGVAMSRRGRLVDAPLAAWARQALRVAEDGLRSAPLLGRLLLGPARGATAGTGRAVLLGVALTVPLMALLGGLLASADAAFAAVIEGLWPAGTAGHVAGIASGALAAVLLLQASGGVVADPAVPLARLRPATTGIVLGALVALHGAYAATTAVVALAGADAFLDDPAAVADWARRGFFQLLAVAAITLVVLLALGATTRRAGAAGERWMRAGTTLAVLLTGVIVAAAVARIWAYSEAYGLTMLRLYSATFACWIGTVFVFLLARAWRVGGEAEWLPLAAGATGLAILLGLNLANPEAVVVRVNLERRAEVERFDLAYLAGLSDDALPALRDRFETLDAGERETVRRAVCGPRAGRAWPAWNLGAERAAVARREICGG